MSESILAVGDRPGTRRPVRHVLERDGCSVIEAEKGPSAWRAMHQRDDMSELLRAHRQRVALIARSVPSRPR